jgi:hypothetical protein
LRTIRENESEEDGEEPSSEQINGEQSLQISADDADNLSHPTSSQSSAGIASQHSSVIDNSQSTQAMDDTVPLKKKRQIIVEVSQ